MHIWQKNIAELQIFTNFEPRVFLCYWWVKFGVRNVKLGNLRCEARKQNENLYFGEWGMSDKKIRVYNEDFKVWE